MRASLTYTAFEIFKFHRRPSSPYLRLGRRQAVPDHSNALRQLSGMDTLCKGVQGHGLWVGVPRRPLS